MLTINHQDIIDKAAITNVDHSQPTHIMGNLPFNVASPLLLQWLHQQAGQQGLFATKNDIWMTLMFQKEVGDVSEYVNMNQLHFKLTLNEIDSVLLLIFQHQKEVDLQ